MPLPVEQPIFTKFLSYEDFELKNDILFPSISTGPEKINAFLQKDHPFAFGTMVPVTIRLIDPGVIKA